MDFISLFERSHSGSRTQAQAHIDALMPIHIDTQGNSNTYTHRQGSERSSNLLAATIPCDQPSNTICSYCWTAHHMEAVAGWLWPTQKWKQQEIKRITWMLPEFGPALVSHTKHKPIISYSLNFKICTLLYIYSISVHGLYNNTSPNIREIIS